MNFKPHIALLLSACSVIMLGQAAPDSRTDPIATAVNSVDRDLDAFKKQQFTAFNARYDEERAPRIAKIRALAKDVFAREAAGQNVECPHKILIELHWLITATADFAAIDKRLEDLTASLTKSAQPECSTLWPFQLDAAYDRLELDKQYNFPPALLNRINSPEKLTAYFNSVSTSDIARTGIDHAEELNEPLADLTRLILNGQPANYSFDPALKATLLDLILHRLRDPVTGYWGERYVVNGKSQFIPDLSMTFHIISFLHGDVPDLDKVVATTLLTRDRDTPIGWLYQGQQYNHNAMDVIDIFKWAWPHVGAQQKSAMQTEIQKLLDKCLHESLQPDGSFKHIGLDSSVEEATYFGASFLVRTGYFDQAHRFWTQSNFPDAPDVRRRIISFIKTNIASGAAGGVYYKSALEQLNYDPAHD